MLRKKERVEGSTLICLLKSLNHFPALDGIWNEQANETWHGNGCKSRQKDRDRKREWKKLLDFFVITKMVVRCVLPLQWAHNYL